MSFKIWVQIEKCDDSGEHIFNASDPIEVGKYDDMETAEEAVDKIIEAALIAKDKEDENNT